MVMGSFSITKTFDSTPARRIELNYDLEYQGEEARALASEALNTCSNRCQTACPISRDHVLHASTLTKRHKSLKSLA
jgi:hypothetical protein